MIHQYVRGRCELHVTTTETPVRMRYWAASNHQPQFQRQIVILGQTEKLAGTSWKNTILQLLVGKQVITCKVKVTFCQVKSLHAAGTTLS